MTTRKIIILTVLGALFSIALDRTGALDWLDRVI